MKRDRQQGQETGLRKIWGALDIAGSGRTVFKTLLALVSPWIWWRQIRRIWIGLDLPRVARETGGALFALISPSAWIRTARSLLQWLELRRLGKGIAAMPVSGARASAGAMGMIVRVSRPIFLFFVPVAFIYWLVMGGGGRTDPRLKVARLPLHPTGTDTNKKLERLLKILDEKADSASIRAKVAAEYLSIGRLSQASEQFQQAYMIDQNNTDAIAGLQDIANQVNDVGNSLALAKKAAEMKPNDAEAQNRLGSSYARAGRYHEAVEAFDRAKELRPNSIVAVLNDAAANAQLGKWEQAEKLCRGAIALRPNEELPQILLADILVRRGTVAQGILVLQRLIADHPRSAYAHQVLGGVQMDSGKLAAAIQSYHAAQELSPEWPLPYLGAGIANLKADIIPEAERNFSIALKLRPDSVTAQLGMAGVLERKSRPEDAIKIYRDVLSSQPSLLMPLNNLAYHLAEQGKNLDQAYTMARQAAQDYPGERSVWDTLGFVCYRSGHTQEALTYLAKAVALSPKNPTARYHLGKAFLSAGKRTEGASALQEAIKLGLQGPQREDALASAASIH